MPGRSLETSIMGVGRHKTGMISRPEDGDVIEKAILDKLEVKSDFPPRDLYKLDGKILDG